jgi:hypothetical protein
MQAEISPFNQRRDLVIYAASLNAQVVPKESLNRTLIEH